jgi:hypothetical protein
VSLRTIAKLEVGGSLQLQVQDFLNLEFLGFWGGGNKPAKVLKFEKQKSFDKFTKSC